MDELCPSCRENGINSRIVPFQINLEEAIIMCEVENCTWPLNSSGYTYIMRDFKDNEKIPMRRKKGCSKKNTLNAVKNTHRPQISTELLLYTPPTTPKEESGIKDGKSTTNTTSNENSINNSYAADVTPAKMTPAPSNISTKLDQLDNLMTDEAIMRSIFDSDDFDMSLSSVNVNSSQLSTTQAGNTTVNTSHNNNSMEKSLSTVKSESDSAEEKFPVIIPRAEKIDKEFSDHNQKFLNDVKVSEVPNNVVEAADNSIIEESQELKSQHIKKINNTDSSQNDAVSMTQTADDLKSLLDEIVVDEDKNTTADFEEEWLQNLLCD